MFIFLFIEVTKSKGISVSEGLLIVINNSSVAFKRNCVGADKTTSSEQK